LPDQTGEFHVRTQKNIHSTAMAIGSKLTGLLPDKVPVTFVGVDAARRPSVSFD
jgi:hypothetical protein